VKSRSGDEPNNNYKNGAAKRPGAAEQHGRPLRETPERVPDDAKKITILLVFLCCFGSRLLRHLTYLSKVTAKLRAQISGSRYEVRHKAH
jgi:hypothetical protein